MANKKAPSGRVAPQTSLPEAAKVIWREITEALPAEHFGVQDRPALGLYVHAAWRAQGEIARDKRKIGTADAAVLRDCLGVLTRLGPQLRLSPSSRVDPRVAGSASRRGRSELRPDSATLTDWRDALDKATH
jgi:phage terminase small subunit